MWEELLEWFDRIEATLTSDAHLAGLFDNVGTGPRASRASCR
jgi:hypothetical protein